MAPSRALGAMTVAATAVLALTACSDDDPGPVRDAGTRVPAEPVQVRRVLEPSTAPCPPSVAQPAADEVAVACDADGAAYRLAAAEIVGGVDDAEAARSPDGTGWSVTVVLDDAASTTFEGITRELVGTEQQLAIVSGGTIVSAPVIQSAITDGRVQITGDLTRDEATALADALEG